MPIGKITPPSVPQTGGTTPPHTADQKPKAPAEGAFKGQNLVAGVKPIDASQPTDHPVVKNHIEAAEQFHEDIRDFDDLMQAGASHPERLRDAGDRVVVQPSPYEVPASSKASVNHDYEDIDALRPGEVFDHLAPKLPERNPANKPQPSAYETPVTAYEKPVSAYETPVSAQRPADYEQLASPYEKPVQQAAAEPIYAEIGPGKTQPIYDRLDPALPGNHPVLDTHQKGGSTPGKETTV